MSRVTNRRGDGETVGIVGAGRFATALAHRIATQGGSEGADGRRSVILWSQNSDVVSAINRDHGNPRLPGVELSPAIRATGDPEELARSARFVVVAVAADTVVERARELGNVIDGNHLVVHAMGAVVGDAPDGYPDARVTEVLRQETPALRTGVLAGPGLWRDLLAGSFASMVVASSFDEVTTEGRRLLSVPPGLRIYTGADVVGVELAAVLAGAYTVAVGLSDGLELGPGPRAVLITRAVAEAARLGNAYGALERTFSGLAGLGNLLVRIQSEHSRDYQLGLGLARPAGAVSASGDSDSSDTDIEGARAVFAALRLARRRNVRMPVLRGLAAVLSGELDPADAGAAMAESVARRE